MNRFILNAPNDFDSAIKTIVRRAFPSATPTSTAMVASDGADRSGLSITSTTKIAGSSKERFVWGTSRFGGSRIIG